MSTTAVCDAADYESRLQQYYFERAEESRAVRVGEKEVSEQAAIVAGEIRATRVDYVGRMR